MPELFKRTPVVTTIIYTTGRSTDTKVPHESG